MILDSNKCTIEYFINHQQIYFFSDEDKDKDKEEQEFLSVLKVEKDCVYYPALTISPNTDNYKEFTQLEKLQIVSCQ